MKLPLTAKLDNNEIKQFEIIFSTTCNANSIVVESSPYKSHKVD